MSTLVPSAEGEITCLADHTGIWTGEFQVKRELFQVYQHHIATFEWALEYILVAYLHMSTHFFVLMWPVAFSASKLSLV